MSVAQSIIASLMSQPEAWEERGELLVHDSGLSVYLRLNATAHLVGPVAMTFTKGESTDLWAEFLKWQPRKVAAMLGRP